MEKGIGLLGVVSCGKENIWGKFMEDKSSLVKFVIQTQVSGISSAESTPPLPGTDGASKKGNLCPAFRQKGRGQRVPPKSSVQLPST